MKKRWIFLLLLLSFCLVFGILPEKAAAEGTMTGSCGENLTWTVDEAGTLTISGTGNMFDYGVNSEHLPPWYEFTRNGSQSPKITSLVLEEGLTKIGSHAFIYCDFVDATIPEGVNAIGEYSFISCDKLERISIPSTVNCIGDGAMHGILQDCPNLKQISVDPENSNYIIDNGVLFNREKTLLLCCPASAEGEYEVPDTVKRIAVSAFYDCTKLTKVVIPDSVEAMGGSAFRNCVHLTSAGPIGENNYDIQFGWDKVIPSSAFYMCPYLQDIVIPEGITEIGEAAFCGTGITSKGIPDGVVNIGRQSFSSCEKLNSITIPESVASFQQSGVTEANGEIRYGQFALCPALTDVYYSGSPRQWANIDGVFLPQDGKLAIVYFENVTEWTTLHYGKVDAIYASNGGEGAMGPVGVKAGELHSLLENGFTAPAGQRFKAWNVDGTLYAPGQTVKIDEDVTITAVWEEIPRLTVTFDANGGSGMMGTVCVLPGETYILPSCDFIAPAGQRFEAWCIDGVQYGVGAAYSVNNNVTVSVIWKEKEQEPATDPDKPITDTLDEILNDVDASKEQIENTLENLSKERIAGAIEQVGNDVFDRIEALEKRIGGSAEINVAAGLGFLDAEVKIVGAKLNANYEKSIHLEINPPENSGIVIPDQSHRETFRFSMKLLEGEHNNMAELVVPVRITVPVPALTTRPKNFVIWHYHDGQLVPVTITTQPFRQNGRWYVSFMVSGFSDFIMAYEIGAAENETGGGGFGKSDTSIKTIKNPDGSTTTAMTNKTTGTVTETTRYKDGSTLVVETEKNGTVTTTDTAANGIVIETVDKLSGDVTVTVTIPGSVGAATVTILADTTPGTVAVDAETGEVVKFSVPTEDGVIVKLDGSANLVLVDKSKDFTDTNDHWAEDAIDFATAHGMFSGTSATTFAPDGYMTRGMIAVVLHNLENNPDHSFTGSFSDVHPGSWYADGVHWMADNGIGGGYGNGKFGADDNITREQLATFLYRYAGAMGYGISGGASLSGFTDAGSVSGYATEAMQWAVGNGLFGGMGDGTLAPQGNATRAQVATILMRFVENVTKS